MARWFRFHVEAMRHPKVARLSDKEFRLWVLLLTVASENDGKIPCLGDLKHILNRRLDHLSTGVERLLSMGLIDPLEGGYIPHNWEKYQYKSDVSTERVKRHREKRNVSVTPPDTETDTETEKSKAYAFDGSVIRLNARDFARWEKAYSGIDIRAALQSRDDWLSGQDQATQKKWFNSTSNWLAQKQQQAAKIERDADEWSMPIA